MDKINPKNYRQNVPDNFAKGYYNSKKELKALFS
jgi:hypothetical protein